jgi:hypothetical protein
MHDGYPLVVLAAVVGLAVYCGFHVLLARLRRTTSPYPALVGSFIPGLLATIGATAAGLLAMHATPSDWCGFACLNLVTYGALGWGYFHFVNLCIASLRIRILEELMERGGEATVSHLFSRYNDEQMITARLERLERGGHLMRRDGRYVGGKPQFLYVARLFDVLRRSVLGTSSPAARATTFHNRPTTTSTDLGSRLP